MKASVHPQYFENAEVVCVCGNRFNVGSTSQTIHIELCSNCHPFYTGEQKFVDTASRIQKFQKKQEVGKTYVSKKTKREEMAKKKDNSPLTLREMLEAVK